MFSKNLLLWVIVAAVVVLVVWAFKSNVFNNGGGELGEGLIELPQTVEEGTVNKGNIPGAGAPIIPGSGQSTFTQTQIQNYSVLVNQYGEKRVQFDERCQMSPAGVTFKNGTTLMFDNRSSSQRTIKVGNQSYYFQPYGYKILTLSSASLPASLKISCDATPDVGSILLQANILQE